MKKICFVAPKEYSVGGINTWINTIYDAIKDKYDCCFINTSVKNIFKRKNKIFRYLKSLRLLSKQKKELKNLLPNIDILHIATSGGFGFFRDYSLFKLCKKYRIKKFLHLHFGEIDKILRKKRGIAYKYFIKSAKLADDIICMDAKSYNVIFSLFPQKTYFVQNPIKVTNNFYNPDSKSIVFIGHVITEKGIFELIKAFENINNKEAILNIIGPLKDSIKDDFYKTIKNQKRIKYFGALPHDETLKLLSDSAFLVLPSYSEGMPYVVLEAMSNRIPCIATKVGSLPQLLKKCGVLVDIKDVIGLTNAMNTLFENRDLRIKLSSNSYKEVIENYSIEIVLKKLIIIWEKK